MSDPQRDIRTWAQAELAKRGHGAKGALAKFLDVRADAITRMVNTDPAKETREIRAHELDLMRKFFAQDEQTMAPPPARIQSREEIQRLLEQIDGLTPDNVTAFLAAILGTIEVNAAKSEQSRLDGRSEHASPRRESSTLR